MDYQILSTEGLAGEMTWDKADSLLTHIILSLSIDQGTFFQDPTFGSRLSEIKKVNTTNINLAQQYIEEALQWLLDTGKAAQILVNVERDSIDRSRLNIRVQVEEADGNEITYDLYKELVQYGRSIHVSIHASYDAN